MTDWLQVDASGASRQASDVIQRGDLLILPTDTVYGVAADPWQPDAVGQLYQVKQRPPDRAIPLLLSDTENMQQVARAIPESAHRLARHFWPGPLTIIVPKHPDLSEMVSSLPTVGLRIPDHDATRAIIRACGGVLAVTSANLSGQPSPLTAHDAADQLGEGIALILDGGACQGGIPSTVVEINDESLHIHREGPISADMLRPYL